MLWMWVREALALYIHVYCGIWNKTKYFVKVDLYTHMRRPVSNTQSHSHCNVYNDI